MRFLLPKKVFAVYVAAFIFFLVCFTGYAVRRIVYPLKYKEEIVETADRYSLSRALVFSMVKVESGFKKDAESGKGAVGLMQITVNTAEYIKEKRGLEGYDLKSVKDNLDFGCYYFRYLLNKFGETDTAIIAYNAGEGRTAAWLKDERYSSDRRTLFKVPYAETESYLKKIKESLRNYTKLYGKLLDK